MRLFHIAATALALGSGAAGAAQDSLTIGMVLEPPNLDPTAGPAAASYARRGGARSSPPSCAPSPSRPRARTWNGPNGWNRYSRAMTMT